MNYLHILIVLASALFACQKTETLEPRTQVTANSETDGKASNTSKSEKEKTEPEVDSGFYKMSGERPNEVCGVKGFSYLSKGYLLKECGTCHFISNQFGVTEFAVKSNPEHSYEVMSTLVNREVFIKATQVNAFCSDCLLSAGDPLLADLKYFVAHITDLDCVE